MNIPPISNIELDIYYQEEYANLYLNNGVSELFKYDYFEGSSYVKFRSIKQPIDIVAGVAINERLYDLETPYGYGGPYTNSDDSEFLVRAFSSYRDFCKGQNIVCEFIRFHPFNEITKRNELFDMHIADRPIVIVDLRATSEERRNNYSKTTRNIVKRSGKRLTIKIDEHSVNDFSSLYYETMTKNEADKFYFFQDKYFKSLMDIDRVHLIGIELEHKIAAIGYFMLGEEVAHYHLSANNQAMSKENGNYLLLDSAFELAKSNGCNYMMLGGGRTSSLSDNLLKFKSKFSQHTKSYYISGLDFMPEKRAELNALWLQQKQDKPSPKLFQLYRA